MTIGGLLASRLRWEFKDSDWFHPNVEKMHNGVPRTDEDVGPWLGAIAAWINETRRSGERWRYRPLRAEAPLPRCSIGNCADVRLVYIKGGEALIEGRIATRPSIHAAEPAQSIRSLEEPGPDENPIVVSTKPAPREIATQVLTALSMAEVSLSPEQAARPSAARG